VEEDDKKDGRDEDDCSLVVGLEGREFVYFHLLSLFLLLL
jgi:hypothetical protein